MRTAPSEPLCLPSTSYGAASATNWSPRLRGRHCVGQMHCKRSVQRILCRASQALRSYHKAYKLLHRQSSPSPETSEIPGALPPQQWQQQRQHQGSLKPNVARPDVLPQTAVAQTAVRRQNRPSSAPSASIPSTTGPSPSSNSTSSIALQFSSSNPPITVGRFSLEGELDPRPYSSHSVSLQDWQPPPTSLQHRTALTRAIMTCSSYTALHQLLIDNATDFNAYHTCAALTRILALHAAGFSPRESRLFKEGCYTLQTILRRQLPELLPRALVVAAYSLARLELPDRELLTGLAAAVEPHLAALQPQGLSSLLWAFARQNHQPPPKWMDAVLSACVADLTVFAPRDLATVIWALAQLRYKVAPARLQKLLDHAEIRMGSFCGRSLSNVVYALALSQQHPGGTWLEAAQARAVALGPGAFSPQGMTQMAWGMSKLGITPSVPFLNLVLEHASERLPVAPHERDRERDERHHRNASCSSSSSPDSARPSRRRELYGGLDLSTLMYSLASLEAQPRADLSRRLLAAVQWALPALDPIGMCNCLWACARLGLYPSKMWMSTFFDASYRKMPYFKAMDLSQSLWALARMEARPPPAWLSATLNRLQLCASMFSPVEVATTMWALARLGVRDDQMRSEVLSLFFIATDRRLSSFKPQELSAMIWALANMRRRPDKEWTAEFLKVTYHRLPSMSGWCLATIAWSLAELSLLPPPAWIYNFVNAARALMNATPVPQRPTKRARSPPPALPAPDDAAASAAGLSAFDLGQMITSLRRLNGSGRRSSGSGSPGTVGGGVGLAKVDEFVVEAEQRLAAWEVGTAAFALQQVGAFLAMSPLEAGLTPVARATSTGGISCSAGELNLAAGEGGRVGGEVGGKRRWQQRTEASVGVVQGPLVRRLGKREGWGSAEGGKRATEVAAALLAGRSGAAAVDLRTASGHTAAVNNSGDGSEASSSGASSCQSRAVTRVLRDGGRLTLAPHVELHVDLGGDSSINLLESSTEPGLWRPKTAAAATAAVTSASSSVAGGGGAAAGGGMADVDLHSRIDDAAALTAEVKRRLLAV